MRRVIVVLGSPNDDAGVLSRMALERLEAARREFVADPSSLIVLTGGFGAHFNRTSVPHAEYARRHLLGLGVPESAFLEPALSGSTIADAELSRPIVEELGTTELVVVTSDFHVERAQLVFKRVFGGWSIRFVGARHVSSAEELARLRAREDEAVLRLVRWVPA